MIIHEKPGLLTKDKLPLVFINRQKEVNTSVKGQYNVGSRLRFLNGTASYHLHGQLDKKATDSFSHPHLMNGNRWI